MDAGGEEHEFEICSILIQKLNSENEEWSRAAKVARAEYFCESVHLRDSKKRLLIQVARADAFLPQSGKNASPHEVDASVEGLADSIMAAIRHKASYPGDRGNVVLALDASSAPQDTLRAIVLAFNKRHGASATLAGFKGIWLVGPDSGTTYCLARRF